jgi:phosphohistidine phosphatase
MEGDFEAVLFSPLVRARETAELAAQAWSEEQRALMAVHQPLAKGFDGALALDAMSAVETGGRLLAVGHEPDLSRVLGELTGARADVKKGGLAIVRLEGGAGGELVALVRPREIFLLADAANGAGRGGPVLAGHSPLDGD